MDWTKLPSASMWLPSIYPWELLRSLKMQWAGKPPVVVIAGPTGIGKTALAVALARQIPGEIVSADSRQIYRHMEIGTAKPTAEERAAVPHHLIDIVDPDQPLSMAEYQARAYATVADIHSRGKIAFLVG